jgi:hypothetical protein
MKNQLTDKIMYCILKKKPPHLQAKHPPEGVWFGGMVTFFKKYNIF